MAEAGAGHTQEPTSESTDDTYIHTLVAQAQLGDQEAFLALYRAIQPKLLRYLRPWVGKDEADDIASEAWARIVTDLHTFHVGGSAFRSWATVIARHRAIDHLRRRSPAIPQPHQLLPDRFAPDDTPADAAERISTGRALRLLAELPQEQAQAVLLRVVMGLDAATAGRILHKRPGAVRTAAHRGLRTLADRLNPLPANPARASEKQHPATTALELHHGSALPASPNTTGT